MNGSEETLLRWRKQSLSGAISLLQEQLPHVASKRLAPPPQCQALEAKAEGCPLPLGMGWEGWGCTGAFCLPLWAAMAVLADTHGGVRCSRCPPLLPSSFWGPGVI